VDARIKSTAVRFDIEAPAGSVRMDPTGFRHAEAASAAQADKPWGDEFYLYSNIYRHATLYAWHPLTGIAANTAFLIRDDVFA
jgi:hypothetical protein